MSSQPPPLEPLDRYECRACGYVYEPEKGDSRQVQPGTPTSKFDNIGPVGSPSGFKENLNYGIGVNALPPGQKNLLIFGVLGIFILILLSFYGLG
jgi:hypothetical protein